MKRLSIIIPVYQAERYVRACLESIYQQGLADDDVEVIVVNDGTRDGSMEQISDVLAQHPNITVITQENRGLSVARNRGMAQATGEYIAFLDADDLLVEDTLGWLLQQACERQVDLAVATFLKMNDEEIAQRQAGTPTGDDTVEERSGQQLLMDVLKSRECYVWRTLYRRSFLEEHHIHFIPGICFEDTPFTHECHLKAGRCLVTRRPMVIYRTGHDSITSRPLDVERAKDFCTVIASTWRLQQEAGLSETVRQRVNDNAFDLLSMVVYAITREIERLPDRVEVVRYLWETAPELRFRHGLKQRLVTLALRRMPTGYLALKKTMT